MAPLVISSASRTGVRRVFSGVAPAPETPGTVDNNVFARIPQNKGRLKIISGVSERNPMTIYSNIAHPGTLKISDHEIPQRYNSPVTHSPKDMFEIEQRLLEKGITIDDIVAAAMGLYVSHGMPDEQAAIEIRKKILKYLNDPNVSSLLLGAILLENELYHKRDNSEIADDPVFLLSDEIIGMAIAECIGGTYARFEFTRYDQKKPGILSVLGPFLDDAIAGLIAGCTSRLYSECV
jgi:alpha-ribazole phosphatase CobZ